MSSYADFETFINSPDVVDIVVRRSKAFSDFISGNPNIRKGAVLTGDYQIIYMTKEWYNLTRNYFSDLFFAGYGHMLTLLGREALNDSGILNVQNQPHLNLRGTGVLIGFVDTGIDYTLPAFRYEDGTSKIRNIWDQTLTGEEPFKFHFGVEFTQEKINEALKTEDPFAVAPHRDTVGHGTFLAAQAASRMNNDYIGAAPDAELIVVKLRKANSFFLEEQLVNPDAENVFGSSDAMLGIEYIYQRAQELNMPAVICVSLGTNMSGHDGFSIFEEYLSIISHRIGTCICAAAGNESQARHHAQGQVPNGGSTNLSVAVGEDGGNVLLNIWNLASDRISVSISSPVGETISRVPARGDSKYEAKLILENTVVSIDYFFPVEGSGGQLTRIRLKDSTPGIWSVTIYGDIILNGTYHAWLPITGLDFPGVEFVKPVPYGTIVYPGTTFGAITCGAYNNVSGSLFPDSSWGPTRLPSMKPDLVAPGDNVSGLLPYGRVGAMSGTSIAAAITAGACALMLQWGIIDQKDMSLNTYRIKSFLIRGCIRDQNLEYPNYQWGYGKLNLYNSFMLML